MKTLLALILSLFALNANAASVTVDDPTCALYSTTAVSGNIVHTCIQAQLPSPPGTPFCSINPSSTSVAPGQMVQLGSGGSPVPDTYLWTGPGITNPAALTQTVYPTTTSTYTLTCSNQYGAGNTASVTINVVQPPPPVATIPCTTKDFMANSSHMQSVAPGSGIAYSFVAGFGGQLKIQYPSANVYISVSATACEFVDVPLKCAASGYVEPGLYYSGTDTRKCILTPGQTYYFNVRTAAKDASGVLVETCQSSSCSFMPAIF